MAAEARCLNRGFICRQENGRPWIRVKIATSLDGRTALASGESQWISGEASRADVQLWRARSSAILTGSGTVLADDPRLTARVGFESLQPRCVVLDSRWRTPVTARLMQGDTQVMIFGSADQPIPRLLRDSRAECVPVAAGEEGLDLQAVMHELAAREINELQVEAGPRLCGALLTARLVDEILVYQAPLLLGDGALPPFSIGPLESMSARTHLRVQDRRVIGADTRFLFSPVYE
jgi:diaminohydroxyphosphoribosylaminopyrimidine deaminase/5-amino-6-(5-phosphoribosylamino)uracil reductase